MKDDEENKKKNRPFQSKPFQTQNPLHKPGVQKRTAEQAEPEEIVVHARGSNNLKVERVGPFYRPKTLTPEQALARKIKRKKERESLKKIIAGRDYDRGTVFIATMIGLLSFGLAKFYLRFYQMWNAAVVEGFGVLIYYVFLPLFQVAAPLIIALLMCAGISFFAKFVLYKLWLFKKVGKSAGGSDNRK